MHDHEGIFITRVKFSFRYNITMKWYPILDKYQVRNEYLKNIINMCVYIYINMYI